MPRVVDQSGHGVAAVELRKLRELRHANALAVEERAVQEVMPGHCYALLYCKFPLRCTGTSSGLWASLKGTRAGDDLTRFMISPPRKGPMLSSSSPCSFKCSSAVAASAIQTTPVPFVSLLSRLRALADGHPADGLQDIRHGRTVQVRPPGVCVGRVQLMRDVLYASGNFRVGREKSRVPAMSTSSSAPCFPVSRAMFVCQAHEGSLGPLTSPPPLSQVP